MGGVALCSASANWLMKPTQAVKFFSVEHGAQSVSSSIEYPCRDQDEGEGRHIVYMGRGV